MFATRGKDNFQWITSTVDLCDFKTQEQTAHTF